MAISFVGSATGTSSATFPSIQTDDVCFVWAFRDGSTTAPSTGSGFTSISARTGTSCSARVAWRRLLSSDTTTGTFTNATALVAVIYRGMVLTGTPRGSFTGTSGTTNSSFQYIDIGAFQSAGGSWALLFSGHGEIDTALETAPTGTVFRDGTVTGSNEVASFDTNGEVTSYGTQSVTIGGTDGNWLSFSMEIIERRQAIVPIVTTQYRRRVAA